MSHKFCTHIGPLKCIYIDMNINTILERHKQKYIKNLWMKIISLDIHESLESYATNGVRNEHQIKKLKTIY